MTLNYAADICYLKLITTKFCLQNAPDIHKASIGCQIFISVHRFCWKRRRYDQSKVGIKDRVSHVSVFREKSEWEKGSSREDWAPNGGMVRWCTSRHHTTINNTTFQPPLLPLVLSSSFSVHPPLLHLFLSSWFFCLSFHSLARSLSFIQHWRLLFKEFIKYVLRNLQDK